MPEPHVAEREDGLSPASEVAFEVAPRFVGHGPRVEDEDVPSSPSRRIAIQPDHVLTIGLVHLLDFGRRVGDELAALVEQAEPVTSLRGIRLISFSPSRRTKSVGVTATSTRRGSG